MASSGIYSTLGGVVTGITAYAGGGATNATQLTAGINLIGTCATAADSVKLPLTPQFGRVLVRNGGAASSTAYPPTGGTINGGSVDAGFAVASAKTAEFIATGITGLDFIAVLSA